MELLVTITLSDRLFELLEDKLPNLGRRVERIITKELGRQARNETEVTVSKQAKTEAEAAEAEAAEAEAAEAKAAEAAPIAETPAADEPAPQPEKELTEEDLRAAMHRTRQRFEGEDYKNNPGSDLYKRHHKALTAMFKQIASALGADKPSALPVEKRAAFIAECDAIVIDENGQIAAPAAPF